MPLFDDWPDRYAAWFATPIGRLILEIETGHVLDLLRPRAGECLLDAGCGSGLFTAPVLARGARVVGLDPSLPMLSAARAALSGEFTTVAGDLRALPFADDRFDRVMSVTALEFVTDGRRAMRELFRVTRPGGTVVVATLNRLGPWARRRLQRAESDPSSLFRHARFRSPAELAALAPQDGEIRTAIHFTKNAVPEAARATEREGAALDPESGAFVVGAWRRP
ncbi:MAG: class I SAM-dependent methyltransferase [Gammaproteobacteria bacterium]|nr:class I SAM-dependent methyltransferase [Gammaproteobacteria bacterium]